MSKKNLINTLEINMTPLELQTKIRIGDYIEIFNFGGAGNKIFTGYVTELYANAFVLSAEGMLAGGPGKDPEFIQTKQFSAEFNNGSFVANWYEKHL